MADRVIACPRQDHAPRSATQPLRCLAFAPDHGANWFPAALDAEVISVLEPSLEAVILPRGVVVYEPGDPIRYTYFPHDAIVYLLDVGAGRPARH